MAKLPFLVRKAFDIKTDTFDKGEGKCGMRLLMYPKKNIWFYILMVKEFLFGQTVIDEDCEVGNGN